VRASERPAREVSLPGKTFSRQEVRVNSWAKSSSDRRVNIMPGSILGTSVRRVEDRDLMTGAST
jgi:hypothetical protein